MRCLPGRSCKVGQLYLTVLTESDPAGVLEAEDVLEVNVGIKRTVGRLWLFCRNPEPRVEAGKKLKVAGRFGPNDGLEAQFGNQVALEGPGNALDSSHRLRRAGKYLLYSQFGSCARELGFGRPPAAALASVQDKDAVTIAVARQPDAAKECLRSAPDPR